MVDGFDGQYRPIAILDIGGVHLGIDQQTPVSVTMCRLPL